MDQILAETVDKPMNGSAESHKPGYVGVAVEQNGLKQSDHNSIQKNGAVEAGQRARVATATFGEIVALLSFSPVFKHISLGDLEWLVIPALTTNQVTTVRGKLKDKDGLTVPLGLAMWAHVSVEVDKKLEEQKKMNLSFRLAPQDWKSGNIPWLLAVVGPKEVAPALVKKLEETVLKDQPYKRFVQRLPKVEPKNESVKQEQ